MMPSARICVDEPAVDLDRAIDHRAAAAAVQYDVVERERGFARPVAANDFRLEQRAPLFDVAAGEHRLEGLFHPRDRDVGEKPSRPWLTPISGTSSGARPPARSTASCRRRRPRWRRPRRGERFRRHDGKAERPVERAVSASNTDFQPAGREERGKPRQRLGDAGLTWRPTSAARRKTVVAEGGVAGDIIGRIKAQALRLP
jgi:hypothetical protein